MMAKTSFHQSYTIDGLPVPSVTTVIGNNLGWNKNVLIAWARKTAAAGIDPDKVKQEAADLGTLVHALIEEYISQRNPSLPSKSVVRETYAPVQLEKALKGLEAFKTWVDQAKVDLASADTKSEFGLVSRWYRYGGTIDLIVPINGVLSLVDFKTSNGVYADHRIQLSAYQQMLFESYGILFPAHLLRIGKEDGTFNHHFYSNLDNEFAVFQHLLSIHELRVDVEKEP